MNVNIIVLGKLKEAYFKQASAEYEKRLLAYCKLRITELEPDRRGSLEAEAVHINAKMPKSYKIALCAEGERLASESFADRLLKARSDISFIIGSSEGLAESVKQSADLKLSLSDMTFPYQLARIMLMEQIYRAFSINNNGKYHK
ncbi:MAG: 23S rRNA (pseudouridine(1915)-N(3))-methyltransferase RlmH [Oscillospiraceae bacterium]|nr:23S rRNA (pseudouridine(1915)-N(3))-methyltransferase RlmH [Oscillospiraceae bacterium]